MEKLSNFAYEGDEWAAALTADEWCAALDLLNNALRSGELPDFMIESSGCRPLAEL